MKKSKIIVPALGILLLSTAASISGTVAWFTATRTFSTTVSEFGVGSVDGNLSAVVAGGVGTKQKGTGSAADKKTILFKNDDDDPSALTDASFNHSNLHLYTDVSTVTEANTTNPGQNTSAFDDLGLESAITSSVNKWKAGSKDGTNYFYAVTWDIQLTFEYAAVHNDVHMFFDAGTASSIESDSALAPAIRFALHTSDNDIVYAPLATSAVYNVASASGVEISEPVIRYDSGAAKVQTVVSEAASLSALAVAEDGLDDTDAAAIPTYLGTVTEASNTLTVHVVCWLDGLDAATINSNIDDETFQGALNFYCRYAE